MSQIVKTSGSTVQKISESKRFIMSIFETYISDGGLMRVILIGFVGYTYLKMVKRVNLLNDKIDFLKAKFDDLQKQISENKQKRKES